MPRMSHSLPLFVLGSLLCAQAPQWRLHPGATHDPDRRLGDDLRFGSRSGRALRRRPGLLPGRRPAGARWRYLDPAHATAPGGRLAHVLAYDEARAETILWGGMAPFQPSFTDTWRWNGTVWTQAFRPMCRRRCTSRRCATTKRVSGWCSTGRGRPGNGTAPTGSIASRCTARVRAFTTQLPYDSRRSAHGVVRWRDECEQSARHLGNGTASTGCRSAATGPVCATRPWSSTASAPAA